MMNLTGSDETPVKQKRWVGPKQTCLHCDKGDICDDCDRPPDEGRPPDPEVTTVDLIPRNKENSKTFLLRQSRIIFFLHHLEISTYHDYVSYLLQKHPYDPDLQILLSLYETERKMLLKEREEAWQGLSPIEEALRQPELSHREILTAFFLTTKGKLLAKNSQKGVAIVHYDQALQNCRQGPTLCLENTYLLHMLASAMLHAPNESGKVDVPSECTWRRVESMWYGASMQDFAMKDILDEDSWKQGCSGNFFHIWKGIHYLCCLIRSCPLGGFLFLDQMSCPRQNLCKAHALIKRLKQDIGVMTLRTKVLFSLFRCYYELRKANLWEAGSEAWVDSLLTAKRRIKNTRDLVKICPTYNATYEILCELRLYYTNQKLAGQEGIDWRKGEDLSPQACSFVMQVLGNHTLSPSLTGLAAPLILNAEREMTKGASCTPRTPAAAAKAARCSVSENDTAITIPKHRLGSGETSGDCKEPSSANTVAVLSLHEDSSELSSETSETEVKHLLDGTPLSGVPLVGDRKAEPLFELDFTQTPPSKDPSFSACNETSVKPLDLVE